MKLKFKKGNTVKVISGDDRGKSGEIIEIFKDRYRATVKGLNMVKKHTKPTKAVSYTHLTLPTTPYV